MVVIHVGLCTSLHCNPALSTVYSCGMQYLAGYLAGNGNVGLSARLTLADNKQCRVVLMEDAATLVLSTSVTTRGVALILFTPVMIRLLVCCAA